MIDINYATWLDSEADRIDAEMRELTAKLDRLTIQAKGLRGTAERLRSLEKASKAYWMAAADLEGDAEVGAGRRAFDPAPDDTGGA